MMSSYCTVLVLFSIAYAFLWYALGETKQADWRRPLSLIVLVVVGVFLVLSIVWVLNYALGLPLNLNLEGFWGVLGYPTFIWMVGLLGLYLAVVSSCKIFLLFRESLLWVS